MKRAHHAVRLALVALAWLTGALVLPTSGCSLTPLERPDARPGSVLLVVPDSGDELDDRLATRGATYLQRSVGVTAVVLRPTLDAIAIAEIDEVAREQGAGLVVVVDSHRLLPTLVPPGDVEGLPAGGFFLHVRDRGDWSNGLSSGTGATYVLTAGPSRLGKQYALNETLRRLGARFYHPEQAFVPPLPAHTVRERAKTPTALARPGSDGTRYTPDFERRSFSFHGSHPLEHQESFSDADHPIDEAIRVNEWIIANFGTRFRGAGRGVASTESRARRAAELEAFRQTVGLARTAGIGLHNVQQGGQPDVDPTSPVPVQQQIETLVEERLEATPDATAFGIHFGPTEFTVTPDDETVQWINWAGQRALELRPDIPVIINDHITGSQPTPNYGDLGCPTGTNASGLGDYYDLAFHTDPRLGVSVHTVMFYPLEGPARVYNQQTFSHKLCLMQQASAQGRPLVWFPEGSWWLSFDNTIPVYLPLYIQTRARDIELVKPLLSTRGGTVIEHRMFNSGHEWGYWQQDYAVGLLGYHADLPLDAVVREIVDPLCSAKTWPTQCEAAREAEAVLLELMQHQWQFFLELEDYTGRPGGLFAYFSGEDPADEIAATTGFEFRPVRPSFDKVLAFSNLDAGLFQNGDVARLWEARDLHQGWLDRLNAYASRIPAEGRPWFDEIVDGVEINLLRAQHTAELYDAVLAYRAVLVSADQDAAAAEATPMVAAAADTVARAEAVIRRREASYRYPAEQMYGGGLTPDTAVDNGTTYPYRVHTKTHLLTYWENRQERAERIVSGEAAGANVLRLTPAIAETGVVLDILWPNADSLEATVDLGDGTTAGPSDDSHDYGPNSGAWPIEGSMLLDGFDLPVAGAVARTDVRARTVAAGLVLTQPSSDLARSVVSDLAPPFVWGFVSEADVLAFGAEAPGGEVPFERVVLARVASGDVTGVVTEPTDFELPIQNGASGSTLPMRIVDAAFTVTLDSGPPVTLVSPIHVDGQLVVADIVDALIALAGFDEQGAYDTLAGILEFDPSAPPDTVPFSADFPLE